MLRRRRARGALCQTQTHEEQMPRGLRPGLQGGMRGMNASPEMGEGRGRGGRGSGRGGERIICLCRGCTSRVQD